MPATEATPKSIELAPNGNTGCSSPAVLNAYKVPAVDTPKRTSAKSPFSTLAGPRERPVKLIGLPVVGSLMTTRVGKVAAPTIDGVTNSPWLVTPKT